MVPSLKWRGGEVYELRFYPAYDDLCLGVNINNLQQKSWYLWYLSWYMVNVAHVNTNLPWRAHDFKQRPL